MKLLKAFLVWLIGVTITAIVAFLLHGGF